MLKYIKSFPIQHDDDVAADEREVKRALGYALDWPRAEGVVAGSASCRDIIGIMPTAPRRTAALLRMRPPAMSDAELAEVVERGLPIDAIDQLQDLGFEKHEVLRLVIPLRTLTHRRRRRQPLTGDESDKVVRLARLRHLAIRVFGDEGKAWHWLRTPSRALGDRAPLDLLATEAGARVIEEELHRIDDGMFV